MKHSHVLVLALFSVITITTTACVEPPSPKPQADQGPPLADMSFTDMPFADLPPSADMISRDMTADLPEPPVDMPPAADEGVDAPRDMPDMPADADILDMPDASEMSDTDADMMSCDAEAERKAFCESMGGETRRCEDATATICGEEEVVECRGCGSGHLCNPDSGLCCDRTAAVNAECQANRDGGRCGTIPIATICGQMIMDVICGDSCNESSQICCGNTCQEAKGCGILGCGSKTCNRCNGECE